MKNLFSVKRIIGLVLLISLAGNVYYFGNQFIQKEKQKVFDAGIMFVFQKANEIGQVSLNLDDEQIILIKYER